MKWLFKTLVVSACVFIYPAPLTIAEQLVTQFEPVELRCLLTNIYFEARGEPIEGQIAVAKVTLNRARESSICKVVYAPNQFSWTLKPYKLPAKFSYEIYQAAHQALDSTLEATHFHTIKVKPAWAKRLTKLTQIGNHVFYN